MKDTPGPEAPSSVDGPKRPGPHVLIVGGGASGVLAAAHILRTDDRACVTLVEPRNRIGLGLAYSTSNKNHLLNVRAANMSAFADDPGHFLGWLARNGHQNGPDCFVSRQVYGEYLADLSSGWRHARPARFRRVVGICTDLTESPSGVVAHLEDDTVQLADCAMLATGHALPQPAGDAAIRSSEGKDVAKQGG